MKLFGPLFAGAAALLLIGVAATTCPAGNIVSEMMKAVLVLCGLSASLGRGGLANAKG